MLGIWTIVGIVTGVAGVVGMWQFKLQTIISLAVR